MAGDAKAFTTHPVADVLWRRGAYALVRGTEGPGDLHAIKIRYRGQGRTRRLAWVELPGKGALKRAVRKWRVEGPVIDPMGRPRRG